MDFESSVVWKSTMFVSAILLLGAISGILSSILMLFVLFNDENMGNNFISYQNIKSKWKKIRYRHNEILIQ